MVTLNDFVLKNKCIIVQQNLDTGDSPQMSSFTYLGFYPQYIEEFKQAYSYFEVSDGVIVRDKQQWNNPKDISRDQEDPVLIMLGMSEMKMELKGHLKNLIKRGGLYPNGDVPLPHQWPAIVIRALNIKWLWPFLLFSDLFLCLTSFLYKFNKDINDCDDDNHISRLRQAELRMPTPFSKLAIKHYVKYRQRNNGVINGETLPALQAIAWKHRISSGGNPAIVKVWRPIVKAWYK